MERCEIHGISTIKINDRDIKTSPYYVMMTGELGDSGMPIGVVAKNSHIIPGALIEVDINNRRNGYYCMYKQLTFNPMVDCIVYRRQGDAYNVYHPETREYVSRVKTKEEAIDIVKKLLNSTHE